MHLYIPFSSTLLVYITVLFTFTILHFLPMMGLVDLPLEFFCAPHVIALVVMSVRVFAVMNWKSEQSI